LFSSGTLHIGKGFITAQNWFEINAGIKSTQLKDAIEIRHSILAREFNKENRKSA